MHNFKTMAKPKANTLQQKLGFFDEDLKSPDHDSILKWIDSNIDTVIDTIYNFREWNEVKVKEVSEKINEIVALNLERTKTKAQNIKNEIADKQKHIVELNADLIKKLEEEKETEKSRYYSSDYLKESIVTSETALEEKKKELDTVEQRIQFLSDFNGLPDELPQRQKPRVLERIWEYTVTNQSVNQRTGYQSTKNVIGFIDMKVTIIGTRLTVTGVDFGENYITGELKWTQTEKVNHYSKDLCTINLLIEVKTKIPSLGELFRQLNTYKEYAQGDYLVVCPDDSNKETIINQGFKFYKFEI
jgi:hypothetical protein